MIGVIHRAGEAAAVEEFFQLFKTPWELYRAGAAYDVVLITGDEPAEVDAKLVLIFGSQARQSDANHKLAPGASRQSARLVWNGTQCPLYGGLLTFGSERKPVVGDVASAILADVEPGILPGGNGVSSGGTAEFSDRSGASCAKLGGKMPPSTSARMADATVRLGYDLFAEVAFLLKTGQPLENANVPTLDLHVAIVRDLILKSGVPLVEIPPTPAGYDFAVCLTHDIDFVGIRRSDDEEKGLTEALGPARNRGNLTDEADQQPCMAQSHSAPQRSVHRPGGHRLDRVVTCLEALEPVLRGRALVGAQLAFEPCLLDSRNKVLPARGIGRNPGAQVLHVHHLLDVRRAVVH